MTDSSGPESRVSALEGSGTPSCQPPAGVSHALSHVRSYSDAAVVDRVWSRLETRRRRSPVLAPMAQAGLAAALVFAGVFVGVLYERQRTSEDSVATVSSEVFADRGVPAGPVNEGPRFQSPSRGLSEDGDEKTRARRTVNRLSTLVKKSAVSEVNADKPEEEAAVPLDEPTAPPIKASWLILAERGEFAAAFQKLDESGGFDAVLTGGSSEELMMLVEVARFVGRQGRAVQALRAVTERHQADPNAPIAAMILGNLLSRSGDVAGAGRAYALNRRLSPGGDFAEDALFGEFDMARTAGDLARVERLRAQYEAEFPGGRHMENIRAEARRLAERSPRPHAAPSVNVQAPAPVAAEPADVLPKGSVEQSEDRSDSKDSASGALDE